MGSINIIFDSLEAFFAGRPLSMTQVAPTLEDAFIHLMQRSSDQFQG